MSSVGWQIYKPGTGKVFDPSMMAGREADGFPKAVNGTGSPYAMPITPTAVRFGIIFYPWAYISVDSARWYNPDDGPVSMQASISGTNIIIEDDPDINNVTTWNRIFSSASFALSQIPGPYDDPNANPSFLQKNNWSTLEGHGLCHLIAIG